ASVEVVVFPKVYAKIHPMLSQEQIVILEAEVQKKENMVKLLAEKVVPVEEAEEEWTTGIVITLDGEKNSVEELNGLKPIVERYPGDAVSFIKICLPEDQQVVVKLGDEFMTRTDPVFFSEVQALIGKNCIETKCAPVKDRVKKKPRWQKRKA
ncbi:MAG: hypothetical protein MI749_10650, partial [Desulfovibrionales bacterium]|nr:hypothetical protein [Desulfovibrionales bacterium]